MSRRRGDAPHPGRADRGDRQGEPGLPQGPGRVLHRRAVTPEKAAEAIIRGVHRNKYWVYTSNDIRMVHLLQRYFPPGYALAMHGMNVGANKVLPDVARATRKEAV